MVAVVEVVDDSHVAAQVGGHEADFSDDHLLHVGAAQRQRRHYVPPPRTRLHHQLKRKRFFNRVRLGSILLIFKFYWVLLGFT